MIMVKRINISIMNSSISIVNYISIVNASFTFDDLQLEELRLAENPHLSYIHPDVRLHK